MKLEISAEYYCTVTFDLDIPVDNLDEIAEWYVKWDQLHYKLKNSDKWHCLDMVDNMDAPNIDTKRPTFATMHALDDAGCYGDELECTQ